MAEDPEHSTHVHVHRPGRVQRHPRHDVGHQVGHSRLVGPGVVLRVELARATTRKRHDRSAKLLLRVLQREGPVELPRRAPREPELRNASPQQAGQVVGIHRLRDLDVGRPHAHLILLRGHEAEGLAHSHVERVAVLNLGKGVAETKAGARAGDGEGARHLAVEVHLEVAAELAESRPALGEVRIDTDRDSRGLGGEARFRDVPPELIFVRERREAGARPAAGVGRAIEAGDPQVAADAQLRRPDGYRGALSYLTGDFLRGVERARRGLAPAADPMMTALAPLLTLAVWGRTKPSWTESRPPRRSPQRRSP